jgi:hypothetical protein
VLPRHQTAQHLSLAFTHENERYMYETRGTMSDSYKTSGSSPTIVSSQPNAPATPTPNTAPPRMCTPPRLLVRSFKLPREHQEQLCQPAGDGAAELTDWAGWLGFLYRHANLRERGRILTCILNRRLRDSAARRAILYDPFEASAKRHICSFWDQCSDDRCSKEVSNG